MAQFMKYPSIVKRSARKYFKDKYSTAEAKERWNRTLEIYNGFVYEAPDIGGKENPLGKNLYMALAVFAFYEATDRSITTDEIKKLISEGIPKTIPFVSSVIDFNKPRNQKKLCSRYEKYKAVSDKKLDNGEWGNSWRIELNPHNREKGFAFDLVGCPLADFAKSHGYEEIMPLLCDFDYITASIMHARLIREHTVAQGYERCDYWYVGDKEKDI